jgi:hypothetical protein
MSERDGNVAFKCTYHDGGRALGGFEGKRGRSSASPLCSPGSTS